MGGKRVRRDLKRLSSIALTLAAAGVVVLAVGATAGRWRVWPVHAEGAGTGVGHDAAVVLVPVPALQIDVGDRIVMGRDHARPALYRVDEIIDTVEGRVRVRDDARPPHDVTLPARVWRMSRDVPYAGIPDASARRPVAGAPACRSRNRCDRSGREPAQPATAGPGAGGAIAEPAVLGSQLRDASR